MKPKLLWLGCAFTCVYLRWNLWKFSYPLSTSLSLQGDPRWFFHVLRVSVERRWSSFNPPETEILGFLLRSEKQKTHGNSHQMLLAVAKDAHSSHFCYSLFLLLLLPFPPSLLLFSFWEASGEDPFKGPLETYYCSDLPTFREAHTHTSSSSGNKRRIRRLPKHGKVGEGLHTAQTKPPTFCVSTESFQGFFGCESGGILEGLAAIACHSHNTIYNMAGSSQFFWPVGEVMRSNYDQWSVMFFYRCERQEVEEEKPTDLCKFFHAFPLWL